jgi:hypothetical protein
MTEAASGNASPRNATNQTLSSEHLPRAFHDHPPTNAAIYNTSIIQLQSNEIQQTQITISQTRK